MSGAISLAILAIVLLCVLIAACYDMSGKRTGARMGTKVIGITGTISSGKSLVGTLLQEIGIPVIDTDHVAHEVLRSDVEVQEALIKRFGKGILASDGSINRKALGAIVFSDEEARHDLDGIVHPAVIRACRKKIAAIDAPEVAVLVPLLFEAGLESHYDEIWTVIASEEVVRERLKKRDGLNDEEANKRIAAQFPQSVKADGSDHVIDNSGTIDDTRKQVMAILGRKAE